MIPLYGNIITERQVAASGKMKEGIYSLSEMAELTGAELRSVQHWADMGVLTPVRGGTGRGHERLFGFPTVVVVGIFKELTAYQIPVAHLGRLGEELFSGAETEMGWTGASPMYDGYMAAIGQADRRVMCDRGGIEDPHGSRAVWLVIVAADGRYKFAATKKIEPGLEVGGRPLPDHPMFMAVNLTAVLTRILSKMPTETS